MGRAVPLIWRVPNAPATFVGRRTEMAAIRDAASRGPLVLVCGPGGIGKTALASAVLRDVFPKRAPRALMVSARPTSPMQQIFVDIVRALGRVEPRDATDLAMHVIDLAEMHKALVVLDDVHHFMPEIEAALVAIARYARRATWIATTRVPALAHELAGQTVQLAPLSTTDLSTLARLVDPKLSKAAATRIGREAEGSPFRAMQIAGEPRHQLDDTSRAVLAALLVVERPISESALAESAAANVSKPLADLVRRGFVEALPGGYRIHDAARSWVESRVPPRDNASTMAALAAGGRVDSVEALGLALKSRDEARALAICASSFDAMLRAGHASTLYKLIAPRTGEAWNGYKLRAAIRLASVKITAVLDAPAKDALYDRLLWVRALIVEARTEQALAAAESLVADSSKIGDATVTFWSKLQRAMAARFSGIDRAIDLARETTAIDASTDALRTALLSFWLAEAGRIDDAVRTLERSAHWREPESRDEGLAEEILGGPLDFYVRYYRMAAYMECGELDRAHAELTEGRDAVAQDDRWRASYVQLVGITNLSLARGRLDEAHAILERLLRVQGSSVYHTITRLLELEWRIASGRFEGIDRALGALLDETRRDSPLVHAWCKEALERLCAIQAVASEGELELDAQLGSVARGVMAQRRALRDARWGRPHAAPTSVDVEGTILREMVAATDAIASGTSAMAPSARAIEMSTKHGWGVRECEARVLLIEAAIVERNERHARAEIDALTRCAAGMRSARFEIEARVLGAMIDDPAIDFATLEEIAIAGAISPIAARRARALLGDAAITLDVVDERVVAAARARADVEIVRVHASPTLVGWGLDARRRMLWLPGGRRASLARHAVLSSVLETLARAGGHASFEDLGRQVWQRRAYHPLQDGNRMRVTFHRLRALVEDDPQHPKRVVLGESSYAFGDEPFTLIAARSGVSART